MSLEEPLKGKALFALALLLFLAIEVLYGRFFLNPLVFDDFNFFDGKTNAHFASTPFDFELRWFSYASLAWTERFFGPLLIWLRMGNILIHFAVGLSLFFFLRRLFSVILEDDGRGLSLDWLAFFGALIFALEPPAVYAAGYLVERSSLLATFFGIWMLRSYMEGVLAKSKTWFLISVIFYFLSVFSKEHAVMLPAVALALTFLLERFSWRWLKELWLPFLLFSGIALLVVLRQKGVFAASYEVFGTSMIQSEKIEVSNAYPLSVITQSWLFFKYLLLWLFPDPNLMSVDMREHFAASFFSFPQITGLFLFSIYPVFAVKFLLKGGRVGLAGFAMIFPWLLFMTEFSTVRIQESFVLYRSYIWMAGSFAALPFAFSRLPAKASFAILLSICIILFPLSTNRLTTFKSAYSLWDDAVQRVEGKEGLVGLDRIYYNRGNASLGLGRFSDAISDLTRVIAISPNIPQVYYARGLAYFDDKKFTDAIADFTKAISLNHSYSEAYFMRALSHRRLNQKPQELEDLRMSCGLGYPRACKNLKDSL